MNKTPKTKCQGSRRQSTRRGGWGVQKCRRVATTVVSTSVGLSRTHYCCDSDECFRSLTDGYPASSRPL